MRIVVQRVSKSSVTVNNSVISSINKGLLILLGIETEDTPEDVQWLAQKVSQLRIFNDENGIMNLSVCDIKGEVLVISQFTLHAKTKKGNRPSYIKSANPETAIPLYEQFCGVLSELIGIEVRKGVFGAMMQVELINDGPVTIIIDSKNKE